MAIQQLGSELQGLTDVGPCTLRLKKADGVAEFLDEGARRGFIHFLHSSALRKSHDGSYCTTDRSVKATSAMRETRPARPNLRSSRFFSARRSASLRFRPEDRTPASRLKTPATPTCSVLSVRSARSIDPLQSATTMPTPDFAPGANSSRRMRSSISMIVPHPNGGGDRLRTRHVRPATSSESVVTSSPGSSRSEPHSSSLLFSAWTALSSGCSTASSKRSSRRNVSTTLRHRLRRV
jgi:hypothetical protein